jgi:glutaminyl-tRNA synthetase
VRYASSYFDDIYAVAEHLITKGKAYVDSQTAEQMRENRGTLTKPGVNSPFRDRSGPHPTPLRHTFTRNPKP